MPVRAVLRMMTAPLILNALGKRPANKPRAPSVCKMCCAVDTKLRYCGAWLLSGKACKQHCLACLADFISALVEGTKTPDKQQNMHAQCRPD